MVRSLLAVSLPIFIGRMWKSRDSGQDGTASKWRLMQDGCSLSASHTQSYGLISETACREPYS
ncbi:hypothetical protein IT41_17920 [Paracoccus halophilus]|uniref:Uncharacterized protein n=1 Tax=Paracoccus halophilus TaxID=376733 RepID=A0A099EVJ2_9RHOB|nr:hypothetical protein IT41_17920 [Paracoccus halophilus]